MTPEEALKKIRALARERNTAEDARELFDLLADIEGVIDKVEP